jgi:hypothetical protein
MRSSSGVKAAAAIRLARATAAMWLSLAAMAARGTADVVEPPADVPDGADHVEAADDSLPGGEVELGLGWVGAGHSIERRRRVSFSGGDLSGTVREGAGDPLAGGSLAERGAWGELRAGKLSTRWSRGLVLGSPGNPWERSALDPGSRRGRSGEGADLRLASGAELLLGRFAGRGLAGARIAGGPLTLGLLGTRREAQASLGLEEEREALELALDRGGAWRAEAIWSRGTERSRLVTAVRQGSPAFHSLAEPKRGGPARSITVGFARHHQRGMTHAIVSAWRFRPSRAGARAALELERPLAQGGVLVAGFEEQQGYRGELRAATGLRQGGWLEWSAAARPIGLALRQEIWGARPGLRDVARAVSSCRIEARLPYNASLSIAHLVFRVRRGESLYLREAESDRMTLRALSGEGQRTQLDLRLPLAHGALRASGQLTDPVRGRRTSRWTLEWIRRSRSTVSHRDSPPPAPPDP